jgi:hypothetical protein
VPALGEVRMKSLVHGEDAVKLGEPTAAAADQPPLRLTLSNQPQIKINS